MKILITGGTGLIGSALTQYLLGHGHQVIIVSRNSADPNNLVPVIPWKTDSIKKEIERSDAVIHLAGASIAGTGLIPSRWTAKHKSLIKTSRVKTGQILTEAIQQAAQKPAVFIQASAIGFYGNSGAEQADEKSPAGSDFLAEICQIWEKTTGAVEAEGVRRVIARIGLVLSNHGGLYPLLALPYRLFLGGKIGDGQQWMSWIHINDLVQSLAYLLEDPIAQGTYNLTAPAPVTNQEFGDRLSTALGRPKWLPIPGLLLKLLLGEAATLALEGRAVYPGRLLKSDFTFGFPDLTSALLDLTSQ